MRVLIAGGGTAGHINPGIAIAKKIKELKPEAEIKFVGTALGLEADIVPKSGFEIEFITVSGFRRKLGIDTVKTLAKLCKGMSDAGRIIKEFKPDLVIGTGGYVCGPVLYKAAKKKIPTLIHEQNAFPGVTNKLLSRYVDKICISFKEARDKFEKYSSKVIYTGNPVRPELLNLDRAKYRKQLNLSESDKLLVVMGGSRGAETINELMIELITKHYDGTYKIIYATGTKHFDEVASRIGTPPQGVEVRDYIYDSASVFAAADLMMCRAGAITVAELAATGTPSILVPSPYVAENHQEYNGRALEKAGGAKVILEKDADVQLLKSTIKELLTDEKKLKDMSESAKAFAKADAVDTIVKQAFSIKK